MPNAPEVFGNSQGEGKTGAEDALLGGKQDAKTVIEHDETLADVEGSVAKWDGVRFSDSRFASTAAARPATQSAQFQSIGGQRHLEAGGVATDG